jgi:NodT family efflux transporter outer membrane factor (OMF) lipoprotein
MKRRSLRINGSLSLMVLAACALSLLGACSTTHQQGAANAISGIDLPTQYTQGIAKSEARQAPALTQADAIKQAGWAQLGDPVLDALIPLALQNNQDLQIATARTAQARAAQKRTELNKLPTLDAGASASRDRASINDPQVRARASQPGFARNSTTYRGDATLNWELDLSGRKDALVSADEARAQAAGFYEQDIRLTVVSDVAKNVITARTLQTRIKLAEESAATEGEIVSVTRAKLRGGQISGADLLRAMGLEQDSKATAARLQHDYGETVKTLAVLLAETPERIRLQLLLKPEAGSNTDAMPAIIATGLPSELLRRRPDIKRAEFQLAAASKDLAASHAERFPSVKLGVTLALVAGTLAKLSNVDSLLATFGPSITWRALDFGRLDAEIERAKGFEKEALVNYKKSVTTAFAEADTALDDAARRQTLVQRTAASVAAQREAWEVVQLQYERGITDLTTALDTKRNLYRSQEANALALQEQLLGAVAVYRALGGSW